MCRGIARATLDGTALPAGTTYIALADDGRQHSLDIVLGEAAAASVSAA